MSLKPQKKIGIDCRLAGYKHAGIGRYVENLVLHLLKLKSDFCWVFFFYDKKQAQKILKKYTTAPNIKIVIVPIKHYSLKEQFKLPKIFTQEKLDILHVPHFNSPLLYFNPTVLTIHDLLWHEQRGRDVTTLNNWTYWIKYLGYRIVTHLATVKAKKIFVPSQTIKKTLCKYYPTTQKKIVVTTEGIGDPFVKQSSKKKLNSFQLVYTGSLYPHKNLQLVIRALQTLPKYKLIVIGSRNVFQEKITQLVQKLNIQDRVNFLGYISDQKLLNIYHQSLVLVQPSLSEGFGLTGIEAMASGLPVLASNIAIFKEIYQDAAIYFDPNSIKSFRDTLAKLTPKMQKFLIKRGQLVSKQYDWKKMAQETLESYQDVLK